MGRYRAKRIGWTTAELEYEPEEGRMVDPYGLWDTVERRYVDKYGQADPEGDYWADGLAVASMRARDLNQYDRQGGPYIPDFMQGS